MRATNISKINTPKPHTSHHTLNPTYEFEIDFYGSCIDAFVGQISMKDAVELKCYDEADLCKIANLSYSLGFDTEDFTAKLGWAKQSYHIDFHGFDISRPYTMFVHNGIEKLLVDSADCGYKMTELVTEKDCQKNVGELAAMPPYLYAAGTFPIETRYTVTSDKPFDPKLIPLQCKDVWGSRFINRFEYDGLIVEPDALLWPYEDATELFAKILIN